MSLFGGDVFASLDNLPYLAYRQGSSVDDSDTISSASSEDYDEGDDNDFYYPGSTDVEETHRITTHSPDELDQDGQENSSSDDPPSPWLKSKAKQRIIDELKKTDSIIHSIELKEVHARFAHQYPMRNFKKNYSRIIGHFTAKTGPFEENQQENQQNQDEEGQVENEVETWWTKGKISKGYSLLYSLLIEPNGTGIESMSVETIWQSHAAFRCYELQKFQVYYKKMVKLVKKHKKVISQDEADFQHDMALIYDKTCEETTLVWHIHPAKTLLKMDVENGKASAMKPRELRETREEYQEFSVVKFCKEVHHEKQRQRAKPFWQWFRNKEARELHESQVKEMRKEWVCFNDESVNELVEKLKRW